MKVGTINSVEQNILNPHGPDLKDAGLDSSVMFKRTLTDLSIEQHRKHMSELADKITAQGQKLSLKADVRELQKYRELITEFLNETVSNSFQFSKENSFEARRRHRVFATVNRVNQKLEELAKDVLSGEKDNLEILHKVDDIRGLILDIML